MLFEGGWVDGKKEGPGKEISGCTIYSGDFKQGERHGKDGRNDYSAIT